MPKPATARAPEAVKPTPKYDGPPVKRVRAIRMGSNDYTIVEETFAGPPVEVRVLKEKSPRVPAEDRVRLYNEEWLGLNRFGSSGL